MKAPTATRYTFEFVIRNLPGGASRILEIGCGEGELSARLAAEGFEVVALDSDEACVAQARSLGVDARAVEWPAELSDSFDAVLFTRSLHHIRPLDEAVGAAVRALRPGGTVIVEDFAIESDSRRTQCWFSGLVNVLDAAGAIETAGSAAAMLEKLDFGEHRHELHSSVEIAHALGEHGPLREEHAAYYFRYAQDAVADTLVEQLLDYEQRMIEAGAIDALGRRFVLTPSS